MNIGQLTAAIDEAPRGPRVGAFFDLDGTLVQGCTITAFLQDRIRHGRIGPAGLAGLSAALLAGGDHLVETSLTALRGLPVDGVTATAERLFTEKIAGRIRPESRALVRAHQRRGHTVAVASSATRIQAAPIARDLGIRHVICTELEELDGVLTGRSSSDVRWGRAKAAAVRAFAREHRITLRNSFGYANGGEDVPFLDVVGRPYALNPHPVMRQAALAHGWPVLTLREPASGGPAACLRTAAAVLGVNAGLTAGAAYGLLTGDPRRGRNAAVALAADAALALAGVRLAVTGAAGLDRARPAVFIANHQSTLDIVVLAALLRHDFTAVAKKEARFDPRMLVAETVLDPVWIDRSDPVAARRSLDGAVRRLRDGTSILVLPEGTRMPTPTLGRFKKGAFHIALQAGVPIVPIVLRNTGELAWRRSLTVSPGTVDVAVLEPVPTTGWTVTGLDRRIAAIRHSVQDTLDDWPGAPPAHATASRHGGTVRP